jgi:diguanylate cyclase (GGDEF)-like protein/putative nucleotidyltransferase with HDIG domain
MAHRETPTFAWVHLYVAGVITAGTLAVALSLRALYVDPVTHHWIILAGLTLLSGSFTIRVPAIPARLSVSETFVFATVLLFGPAAATLIVVLESLVISLWLKPHSNRSKLAIRLLFNMAAPSVSIWIAAHFFYWLAGVPPLAEQGQPNILSLVVPLLALAVLYFLLNSLLIAGAIALEKHLSVTRVWRENFLWLSLNYLSGASVAALLLPYLLEGFDDFLRIVGVLLPLLLISYLTLKTALARVEDANRHLAKLNQLYLSTIETLAMAIDAKDQITHGHIRRVQHLAIGLSRAIGIKDDQQIRAIEAAALLHDMGKLAVPEYILNKPGPLTPAEFERMKLHASVGADILSSIDFPYPVVPIVRHHHENWDGSGYPDGLRGSEIPVGARVLSVVDCFDALTSDRPYRPRLSDAEALKILRERRSTMYDPLIVDTFEGAYAEILPPDEAAGTTANALNEIARGNQGSDTDLSHARLDDISASTEEMLVLYDLARELAGRLDLVDAGDLIAKHLRRIIPTTTAVFYIYDEDADELRAAHGSGDNPARFSGVRISRGQRLTGWVAANRQTIVNSDPYLDLGEVARSMAPRLRSCLSTPLLDNDQLVGVLSVYSVKKDAFTDDHRRIIEAISRQVSQTVRRALRFEDQRRSEMIDLPSGLPNAQHLKRFVESEIGVGDTAHSMVLIYVAWTFGQEGRTSSAGKSSDSIAAALADLIKRALRGADILFRYSGNELVALLTQTRPDEGVTIRDRIARDIASLSDRLHPQGDALRVRVGSSSAPAEGRTASRLIDAARRDSLPVTRDGDHPPLVH